MELIKALLMGLLQGIVEFMPVSSAGHLAIVNQIINSKTDMIMLFVMMLHIASIVAVVIIFFKDMVNLTVAAFGIVIDIFSNVGIFLMRLVGKKTDGYYILNSSPHRKFFILIFQTSVVAGILGLGMSGVADSLWNSATGIGVCFFINSGIILLADKFSAGYKKIKNSNAFDAVIIGAVQGFAVLPGLSRMGLSVMAAMALGIEKNFAVKYSLISSVPIIIGAFCRELMGCAGVSISMDVMADYMAGAVMALIVSVAGVKVVLGIIKKYSFKGFAVYGAVAGLISIITGLIK